MPESEPSSERPAEIRFDGWTLRRNPLELYRGTTRVRLQDRPLQILEALLLDPGALLTREQLIARLWPKRIVEFDAALNAAVRRLRAALGDEAEAPRYIETLPRHGYRFIGRIDRDPFPTAIADGATSKTRSGSRRPWSWGIAAAMGLLLIGGAVFMQTRDPAAVVPTSAASPQESLAKSIVVLPFADLSAEQDQQYFSDGLTEEILNSLAQSRDLRVIARTSSFSYKGRNVDIATVARELAVTHVLEGSVRRSKDDLRITAQLVDAADSSHLWSKTYDRKLDDIFDVQSEIAASVADALRVALERPPPATRPGSSQAYEHFLQARFFFQRRSQGDVQRAREHYERALALDPRYSPAWAGVAGTYWILTVEGSLPRDAGLAKVREAAERALTLDPRNATAELRMVNYLWATRDYDAASERFRRAAAIDPNDSLLLSLRAGYAADRGRWDEAIALQRRVVDDDPFSAIARGNLAYFLFLARRFDEARSEASRQQELDPTRPVDALAFMMILEGRFEAARQLIESWPDGVERTQCLALVYHALGRRKDADEALRRLIDAYGESDAFRVADVLAFRQEPERAFAWLDRIARMAPERVPPLTRMSPFLEPLHADPRWDAWYALMAQ